MLFNSITDIKQFMPIGVSSDFNRLKPHIENAEIKFIKPLLGSSLFDELQEFFETPYPVSPTDVQQATKELLNKIRHATIHLAYFVGFDFLNIHVSDTGFQRLESQTTKGLFKYQEDNLRKYFSDSGFNALDDILVFIEENITHFNEFKAAPNYTVLKEAFIPTAKTVEDVPFNIHGSRLIFLALQPHIAFIEDTAIRPVLGETIYTEIKAEMIKDAPAAKVKAILPYIRKPLIYLASSMLMEETGASLSDKGLFLERLTGGSTDNKIKEPSSEQRINVLSSRNRNIGNSYLDFLKSYLIKNISDWETYSGQSGSVFSRDNTDKKTFWA